MLPKTIAASTPLGIAFIGCFLAGVSLFTPWGDKIAPPVASAALAGSLGLAQTARRDGQDDEF